MNRMYALNGTVGKVGTALCLLLAFAGRAHGQAEVQAWSNITGIRVDGELMEFETSLRVVSEDWATISSTGKERQRPSYSRRGGRQIVSTRIDSLIFTQEVVNVGRGAAHAMVEVTSRVDTSLAGAFFSIRLSGERYENGSIELIDLAELPLSEAREGGPDELLRVVARGLRIEAPRRSLEVTTEEPSSIVVRREGGDAQIYFALASGALAEGQTARKTFALRADGEIDVRPIELTLDTSQPGRRFDGLGGNFRLQNPRTDPLVIDYSLDNLRVAWARVDMPWMLWHPEEDVDPTAAAEAGDLHPRVAASMEMAQRVYEMGIPVMLAAWFAPEWAIVGERHRGRGPDGLFGNPLRREKIDQIYESIADYVLYLRDAYGVDVEMFSFNESDLGIDVRQTAEEHAHLIKHLGALFEEKGLATKLLLGDTADITGYDFIDVAMNDPETHPYIGAVSLHSWRGWSTENLQEWDRAAEQMGVPLVVGEGSIDAGAWRYPEIFLEPTYAREEITLYTRIMAIAQPLTILQWQLTADYSPLAGGGIFGNDEEPLHPTQRFWNLKQLASTPPGLFHMPVEANRPGIIAAGLGDGEGGLYTVHVVNNGAAREATLTGLPREVESLHVLITDETRGMEERATVRVVDGAAGFMLPETSFVTLTNAD